MSKKLMLMVCGLILVASHAPAQSKSDLRGASQQVEIMARVLKRGLGTRLKGTSLDWYNWAGLGVVPNQKGKKGAETRRVWYDSWLTNGVGPDVKGHYVPGVGAVFTLAITLPTEPAPKGDKKGAKPKRKKNDLWDQVEKEMKTGFPYVLPTEVEWDIAATTGLGAASVGPRQLSKSAERKLKQAIVALLAEHGRRLDRLSRSETVAVHVTVKAQDAVGAYLTRAWPGTGVGQNIVYAPVPPRHIVLVASVKDLRAHESGEDLRVKAHAW